MSDHPQKHEIASELTLAKMTIHQRDVELSKSRLDVDWLQRELGRANAGWEAAQASARHANETIVLRVLLWIGIIMIGYVVLPLIVCVAVPWLFGAICEGCAKVLG